MSNFNKKQLEERTKYIGASEATVIWEGKSFEKTVFHLYIQKQGETPPDLSHIPAVANGQRREGEARAAVEDKIGKKLRPKTVYHKELPYVRASLDGMSLDQKTIIEIKCMMPNTFSAFKETREVPSYYMPQLQHQLACLPQEINSLLFCVYSGEGELIIEEVARDVEFIDSLMKKEALFWRCVQNSDPYGYEELASYTRAFEREREEKKIALTMSSRDEYKELAKKIILAHKAKAIAEEDLSILKKELITFTGNKPIAGEGIVLTKRVNNGRLKYEKLPFIIDAKNNGFDFTPYTGDSTVTFALGLQK